MIHLDVLCGMRYAIRPFKTSMMGRGHTSYLHSSVSSYILEKGDTQQFQTDPAVRKSGLKVI